MKVLFQTRYNVFERSGGDTIQLLKTKEYIEKLFPHISVDIINDPSIDLSEYDIIHIFNLLRPQESLLYLENAIRQNKKVALSTIYWKSEEFEKKAQIGPRKIVSKLLNYNQIEKVRAMYRYYIDGEKHEGTYSIIKRGFGNSQKHILCNSDILLPNGEGEIELLKKELNISETPNYVVVPNAIDIDHVSKLTSKEVKRKDIICVGRIEPRKNQLNLVKAMRGLPFNLYIIGKAHETQKRYFSQVKKEANKNGNVFFIEEMAHNELTEFYQKAKVHVLPSWYDTPGLVSLEAAVHGCNIVVSRRGTTNEYFGEYASYCEPDDTKSIRNAIKKSYLEEGNNLLKDRILENYTWNNTAYATVKGYTSIL